MSTIVGNPALAGDSPLVNTATSTPGMMSILGGSSIVDTGVPPILDTTGNVPSPPAAGTGDAGSGGAAAPAGGSLDLSTILGDLFNAGSGQWFSGLGTYGTLAGLGGYTAGQAQKSNAATIAPINAVGQPFVDAGNQLLTQAQSGTLTPSQQQVVSTSQTQGQTLIDAASPVGQIAQGLFKQYSSGQLNPGDQAQLDAQVASAKQQLRQSLGPNVDSSMLATYDAQIDNQALMTKQQMLNSYLATGNTEFDQWAQTTQAGQATILQGQQYAVQQIDKTFQQALEASSLGGNDILAGIQLAVQSNTQIASALQSFYGNLAKAYAMQVAGGAASRAGGTRTGSTGGGGTNPSSLINQARNLTGSTDTGGGLTGDPSLYSGLTDTSGTPYFLSNDPALNFSGGATDASGVSDLFGPGGAAAPDASTSTLGDLLGSSLGSGTDAATTGVTDLLGGFSTAGGGAAAGTGAGLSALSAGDIAAGAGGVSDAAVAASLQAGAAMPAADAALGGADAAAGGAGLGAAGSLGLIGLALAPALYGMSQPPYTVSAGYYDRTAAALQQGMQPGQPGWGVLENTALNPGATPPGVWDQLAQYGITKDNIQAEYAKYAHMGAPDSVTGYASVGGGAGGVLPV